MPAPQKIIDLVTHFRNTGKIPMKETILRQQFVDKFFEELGWDVTNEKHKIGREIEVDMEESIETREGRTEHKRAPDYSFRVDGKTKFFVEAKKPSVDIHDGIASAYQVRRYGWSAKLGLSILTDFEEFAIYDCRVKPKAGDKAKVARKFYCTFEEYAEKWDEIANIFSREAALSGKLDKYAGTDKKKGTVTVNDDFLKTIEEWRNELARNLAVRNPSITQDELNFAVTKIIDRIIFLRIAEDRNIENEGTLQRIAEKANTHAELKALFQKADTKYNSGLFHFKAEKGVAEGIDTITPSLKIDDALLKKIIGELYFPQSEYEFSVMPADILGQVYEQFLGKVIRLTDGHHAKVEEKPEVRKAGGVYYTPEYIVEYIVKNTVGKLCEGKTLKQVAELKIVDPACGSGSFLIGAYQYLLDWHLAYYIKHIKTYANKLETNKHGNKQLKIEERKRILLNNIYGVDIDGNAVEVTKLSLLLKTLEGEIKQKLWIERMLPDLSGNIKCGNSLIGSDFYQQQSFKGMDAEERKRINVFDWESAFPTVFAKGGFDAVIGNPPYIRIQTLQETAPHTVAHYNEKYKSTQKGNYDIYVIFVELGLNILGKNGKLGFILPHKFFNAKYGQGLRSVIAEGQHLEHIVHFGDQQVFDGASTYTCLLFLSKLKQKQVIFERVVDLEAWINDMKTEKGEIVTKLVTAKEWNFVVGKGAALFEKLRKMPVKLGDIADIFQGLVTGCDRAFIYDHNRAPRSDLMHYFLKPDGLSSYEAVVPKHKILFPYNIKNGEACLIPPKEMEEKYKSAWQSLKNNSANLRSREGGKWNHEQWYAFGRSQNLTQMSDDKLIIQVTAKKPTVIYDNKSLYVTGGGSGPFYGIRPKKNTVKMFYLLGILNSRLFGFFVSCQSTPLRGGYIKYSKQYIVEAPIHQVDFSNSTEKSQHDKIVSLVDHMLALNKAIAKATLPHDRDSLQRQITATDQQIDDLVFDLYGLSEEERKVVLNN